MAAIEAVVFDIGNVLVEWHPERAFDRAIGRARREALFAGVDLDTMNLRVDMGEEIADVVAETAAAHPGFHDDILLWHSNWLDMLYPAIPRSVTMLHALRARVTCCRRAGTGTRGGGSPARAARRDDNPEWVQQVGQQSDLGVEILEDPHNASALGGIAVRGHGHEIHLDGKPDVPRQVGNDHEGPFEHPDQQGRLAGIVGGDLLPQFLEASVDLFGGHEDLGDVH